MKCFKTIIIFLILISFICGFSTPSCAKANDYSKHWAAKTIDIWLSSGLAELNSEGSFIEPQFASNTISTITVTLIDSSGNPITSSDACKLMFSIAPNISYFINGTLYKGPVNDVLILLQPDSNGIAKFTITLPDITGSHYIFQLYGTNNRPIGSSIIYAPQ